MYPMRVTYYSTIPPPVFPGTEAMMKEIELLKDEFNGEFLNLYPFSHYIPGFPKVLTGLQHIRRLNRIDKETDIHHVFLHHLFPLPVLRVLRKPVVCSVISATSPVPGLLRRYPYHVVIHNQRDAQYLKKWGFNDYSVIFPGIDTSAIIDSPSEYHNKEEFILFCGSAPWTRGQFREKGFDLLLALAAEMPNIRLVCLWRGVLYEDFIQKIKDMALQDRVEVINRKVDINPVLERVHAGIVLAESPGVAAAYPRSLIESLVAGKPVISSGCLPIAEYIRKNECGYVVESFSSSNLKQCVEDLMTNYQMCATNARSRGRMDFSKKTMIESFRRLYLSLV